MAPPDSTADTDASADAKPASERRGTSSGPAQVPLEILERNLTTHRARIAAEEARWLDWLREYDEREGWREWGCVSAAHWLSWKCAMGGTAARERVRVARAMAGLPLLSDAFRQGRLTWSKMRALTRVATIDNEVDLAALAVAATGAQLERLCAAIRPRPDSKTSAATAFASRAWTRRRNHDGTTTYTLRVTDDAAAAIDNQLDRQLTSLLVNADASNGDGEAVDEGRQMASPSGTPARRDVIAERGGIAAVRADAAAILLTGQGNLAGKPTPVSLVVDADAHDQHDRAAEPTSPNSSRRVADVPAGTSDPSADHRYLVADQWVAPAVGRRLCCDPRVTPLLESALRSSVSVGRTQRLIPPSMRLALERRDGHACRFPGCHARRHLHAHHITHWIDGGETSLDNLVLLCHFHHHLVHDAGWEVTHELEFHKPGFGPVNPEPDLLRNEPALAELVPDPRYAGVLEPPSYDRLDLAWASAVIAENEAARHRQRHADDVPAETSIR